MTGDQLTPEQRQRLAVLSETRQVLLVELDAFDLISCAHWVHTGRHAPPISEDPEIGPDAARWSPKVVQS